MTFLSALLTTCFLWQACWLPARLATARWLRPFAPLERLCLSVVAGALGIYSSWMLGLLLGSGPSGCLALAVAAWALLVIAALAWGGRSGTSILPGREEARWAVGTMAIPAWMLLLAWTQSTLYGGGWSGDWDEHYRRALFFLGRIPAGQALEFAVTDRPPLFNLVAATWMSIVGAGFWDYQVVHLVWSSIAAIPCLLLLERLTGRSFRSPSALAFFGLVFVLHPTIVANSLYTWTRMPAAFFVLAALYFYLLFHRDRQAAALPWSFLSAALGVVTHYSALVPAAMIVGHWLWRERSGRLTRRAGAVLALAMTPGILWALWSVRQFGWRATLASNTTARNYANTGMGIAGQWGYNLLTTIVPFWDWVAARPYFRQTSLAGAWSDALHLYWVSTLEGSVSTALVVACAVVWLRRAHSTPAATFRANEGRGLIVAALAAFFLSFPTIPNAEVAGFAHLALQPVAIVVCLVGVGWIVSRGAADQRLFVVLYGAEGLLYYWLKTFDRSLIPADQLGFGYRLNLRIQESHHLVLLFGRDPALAPWARGALLAGIVLLCLWCFTQPLGPAEGARDAPDRSPGAAIPTA